jgi:hypothetical protein
MRSRLALALICALLAAAGARAAGPPQTLDPSHLPRLPERGLARQASGGVVLETLRGRPIGLLPRVHLALYRGPQLLLEDAHARLFALDLDRRALRRVWVMPQPVRGCLRTDQTMQLDVLVCGRTIETRLARGPGLKPLRRVVARPPRYRRKPARGSWVWAKLAPKGQMLLAQWNGECESPTAFLITRGTMRPFGAATYAAAPESFALGWLHDGRAVVALTSGLCGSGYPVPGVYAVPRHGRPQLLRPTGRMPVLFGMWGA